MDPVTVRPVRTEDENQAFLRMPWLVYKDDPRWVAPFWQEHQRFFDPNHNAELSHIDLEKFVAWRGRVPVGTIIAHINRQYNEFHGVNVGWFGQLEVLQDGEAASALLACAEAWLRERQVSAVLGPATYSTNSEIGLLVEGFDRDHVVMTSHARPYYQDYVEAHGYLKQQDLLAYLVDMDVEFGPPGAIRPPEKLKRVTEKIIQRRRLKFRHPDMKNWRDEIAYLQTVYNRAWEKNWGFVPMSSAEVDQLAENVITFFDPRVSVIVEQDGKMLGFSLPLPDIYQALRPVRCRPGEPHWWQLLRFIWHWKVLRPVKTVRVWGMGVVEEARGMGVDAVMLYEMLMQAIPAGYRYVDASWILEDNNLIIPDLETMGMVPYKRWRVYRKDLV